MVGHLLVLTRVLIKGKTLIDLCLTLVWKGMGKGGLHLCIKYMFCSWGKGVLTFGTEVVKESETLTRNFNNRDTLD